MSNTNELGRGQAPMDTYGVSFQARRCRTTWLGFASKRSVPHEEGHLPAAGSAASPAGRPEIQEFVGALHGAQADRGVFITTSRFTPDAKDYAERVAARLVLIDGRMLTELMVDLNIGVQDRERYVIKRIDQDFFEDVG
jgi:hypothetical protein